MKTFRHAAAPGLLLALLLASPVTWTGEQMAGFISIVPSDVKWTEAPSLGPGVRIAVLEGDTKAAGPVTFRINFPPNSKVAAHTHPLVEHFTVLSGTFYFGIGEKFDPSKAKAYPVGGFGAIQPGVPMFALTKEEGALIQVHGIGPWGITYLNSHDGHGKKN
jgi:quercetin dioxygenase-like cupin family protein